MKRRNVLKTIAMLAAGLAIPAFVANHRAVAGATAPQPLHAVHTLAYVGHDGAYNIWSGQGNGSVVGNSSRVVAVKVMGKKAEGVSTITTANGDSVLIAFTQTWDQGAQSWEGSFTVTGGTGRFANASGGGNISAIFNSDGTITSTLDGRISL